MRNHDVILGADLGPDPGDDVLLGLASAEARVVVTIDTDFGDLVFRRGLDHAGLVRLPDVRVQVRIALMAEVLDRHSDDLAARAIITVRGGRIRVTRS